MPPYQINLDEALRNGLKVDARVPSGALALDVCDGLRPTQFGLKDFIAVTQETQDVDLTPQPGAPAFAYPYPQLFRGATVTLLCFETAIYSLEEVTWTGVEIALYDAADFGDAVPGAGSITAGGPWQFVDYHDTWILFNGATTIWKTGYYSLPIATDEVTITTGCDLKGRMFMGGFDPTDFYALADWPTYWKTLLANAPPELEQKYRAMAAGAGSNWAWWSTIGGGDLLWLISSTLYTTGEMPPANMIVNGTFTSNADLWTVIGFTQGGGAMNGVTSTGSIAQSAGAMTGKARAGRSYSVTFTIFNHSGGSITPSLSGVTGTARITDGTFTETLVAPADNPTLTLQAAGPFSGSIDDVIMYEIDPGTVQWSAGNAPWDTILGRNEFGMCPLPWQGTVLCQMRLGDTVICYGDGGITALVPHSAPVAAMAPIDIHGIGMGVGIASRCAVGGSKDEHVFIDTAGELWRIGTDLVAQRIGYGYIFADLLGSAIIVNYDPHRREYYISGYNGSSYECYVLTSTGLGKAPWTVTSIAFTEGGLVGIIQGSTAAGVTITTNRFGSPDRKSIDQIELVALTTVDTDATGWSVTINYRLTKDGPSGTGDWSSTTPVVCDARGVARVNVTGLEFQIVLTHPDRAKCDLDGLEVHMMGGGKRSLSLFT